jgi:SGNH hydrolase-like domain, acetyltransferase AlgX
MTPSGTADKKPPPKLASPRLSARARVVLVLVFGIVLLAAAEGVIRVARVPPGYFPFNFKEDSLYIPDPTLGYTLRPGAHHDYVTPDLRVAMDVSADGLRNTSSLAAMRQADYRVLSIGDSFTFGLAVAREDTWSAQLQGLLQAQNPKRRVQVVNAGVPGYSPRQIRERLEEFLPLVKPQLVIFGFTTETYSRIQDPVALYGRMLVRSSVLPNLRTTAHGILYSPFRDARMRALDYWCNQHLHLGAHILGHVYKLMQALRRDSAGGSPAADGVAHAEYIREQMQPSLEEMATIHRILVQQGIPLIVLLINMQRPDGQFDLPGPQSLLNQIVSEECRREKITCVDVLPELERLAAGRTIFRTVHDQHWTPAAHRVAAEALLRAVTQLAGPTLQTASPALPSAGHKAPS